MKVRELLLELAEILDRHSSYGAWIEANSGKIHPVESHGHGKYLKQHFPHKSAFDYNLVRIVHANRGELNVQGKAQDIQKIARIIISTIVQPDMDSLHIRKMDNPDGRRFFALPEDRRAAIQFINAG